jgi:hypothetical protein
MPDATHETSGCAECLAAVLHHLPAIGRPPASHATMPGSMSAAVAAEAAWLLERRPARDAGCAQGNVPALLGAGDKHEEVDKDNEQKTVARDPDEDRKHEAVLFQVLGRKAEAGCEYEIPKAAADAPALYQAEHRNDAGCLHPYGIATKRRLGRQSLEDEQHHNRAQEKDGPSEGCGIVSVFHGTMGFLLRRAILVGARSAMDRYPSMCPAEQRLSDSLIGRANSWRPMLKLPAAKNRS